MLLINCWFSFASLRENEYSILSESGYPGFKDLQDVIDKLLVFLCVFAALRLPCGISKRDCAKLNIV
jgi:hypothetical protein